MTFSPTDRGALQQFVRDGYVIYRGVFYPKLIEAAAQYVFARFTRGRSSRDIDLHDVAVTIMDNFQHTDLHERLTGHPKAVSIMQQYLGPDVCLLGYDALWINAPKDKNPVLLKGIHQDAWTGTSVNTIFAKVFLTDCDEYNGVTVYPGSHLQGQLPVRNREVDPSARAKFKGRNLTCKAGDWLLWHPLLLHSTTGHSGKHTRVSMTSRYSSTETPFSSQERALGYRTLSVGPLNAVLRLVGNDYLTPMRTYGGKVAIDRRMGRLYGQ